MDETREEEVAAETPKNKGGRPRKRINRFRKAKRPPKSRKRQQRYKDPVTYARACMKMAKARKERDRLGGPARLGVPDGWTRAKAELQRVYDGIRADLLMDRMKAEGMIEQTKPGDFEIVKVKVGEKEVEIRVPLTEAGMAEAALREAVIGALSPMTYSKDKLGHIRTVLEYTKKKPATDSNVNLSSEEWLDAALKDNNAYGSGEDGA
jgi:hypothetical protein